MNETWRSFATAHYHELKLKSPSTTFKDALKSAAPLYRKQKDQLYVVRGQVAAEHRTKARSARGAERIKHLDKSDRLEAHKYGAVLRNLDFDFDYGLFEEGARGGSGE